MKFAAFVIFHMHMCVGAHQLHAIRTKLKLIIKIKDIILFE